MSERRVFGYLLAAALFLTVFRLGQDPPGLAADEASIGWNGWSVARTLRDQDGVVLPVFFRALDDWKSPVVVYGAAAAEAVLGPTPLAVRLPAALLQLGAALALFFLARELTGSAALARWSALLLLCTPSLFTYARMVVSEASAVPCLLLAALALLLRFERAPSPRSAALAGVAIALSGYAYTTMRLYAPLCLVLAAAASLRNEKARANLKWMLGAAALVALPAIAFVLRHPGAIGARFDRVSIWSDHPGALTAAARFVSGWALHLSPDFLFLRGEPFAQHNPGGGLLPVWLAAPALWGVAVAWQRRREPFMAVLLGLLILAPLPVALTREGLPHTSRILHLVPLCLVLAVLAAERAVAVARGALPLVVALAMVEQGAFAMHYFTAYPGEVAAQMDGGLGEALRAAFRLRREGEAVVLPRAAFDFGNGALVGLCGALDAREVRERGFEALGVIVSTGQQRPAVVVADRPPRGGEQTLATIEDRATGGPAWFVYRTPARLESGR